MFDHGIGGTELVILLVIVLVVFGSKRLPDSARSLGRSLRIFKAETKGLRSDEEAPPALPPVPPLAHEPASTPPGARFDPATGQPLARFDPYTGEPLNPPARPDRTV